MQKCEAGPTTKCAPWDGWEWDLSFIDSFIESIDIHNQLFIRRFSHNFQHNNNIYKFGIPLLFVRWFFFKNNETMINISQYTNEDDMNNVSGA